MDTSRVSMADKIDLIAAWAIILAQFAPIKPQWIGPGHDWGGTPNSFCLLTYLKCVLVSYVLYDIDTSALDACGLEPLSFSP